MICQDIVKALVTKRWNIEKLYNKLIQFMFDENFNDANNLNQQASLLVKHITKSCDAARTKKKHTARRKPEYWWNSEVEIMRNDW